MEVNFKSIYTINSLYMNVSKSEYKFWVNKGNDNEVKIILQSDNKNDVELYNNFEITGELINKLESTDFDFDNLSNEEENKLKEICSEFKNAMSEFLYVIKYMLDWYELKENGFGSKGYYWYSEDKGEWLRIPLPIHVSLDVHPKFNISPFTEDYIQKSLDGEYWKPFIAFNHLHKAKKDRDLRHKWIHATIAAELAIKEFFIQLKPEFEKLLLEMPSPPLSKLYGRILQEYTGKRSPYVNKIRKGVEIRNKLIHRPLEEVSIDIEKVEKYIQHIEKAIFHLISLLYEEDEFINKYLE